MWLAHTGRQPYDTQAVQGPRVPRELLYGCHPKYWEQKRALQEILETQEDLDLDECESLVASAHSKLGALSFYVADPAPLFLAHVRGLIVLPDPRVDPRVFAVKDGDLIRHCPHPDKQRVGAAILHETAEDINEGAGGNHTAVQLMSCMLAIPHTVASDALSERGLWGAARELRRRYRHVPTWMIRMRVFLLLARESGTAGESLSDAL